MARSTYTRRYFWASQTLGLLNDEIEALLGAYRDTFTEEVWAGEHKILWFMKDASSRNNNFKKKLAHHRKLFEKEIKQLEDVLELNRNEQKDIKTLRDQLFSGTSVLESREAVNQARITVMQGYNIRLLTLVSIFFLPMSFITGVFGMTNMPPNENFVRFAISIACACIPTYCLIACVNSPENFEYMVKHVGYAFVLFTSCFRRTSARATRYSNKHLRKKAKVQPRTQRTPTRASLDARLAMKSTEHTGNNVVEPVARRERIERGSSLMFARPSYDKASGFEKTAVSDANELPQISATHSTLTHNDIQDEEISGREKSLLQRLSDRFLSKTAAKSVV